MPGPWPARVAGALVASLWVTFILVPAPPSHYDAQPAWFIAFSILSPTLGPVLFSTLGGYVLGRMHAPARAADIAYLYAFHILAATALYILLVSASQAEPDLAVEFRSILVMAVLFGGVGAFPAAWAARRAARRSSEQNPK
jgi:hypothetical protein